MKKQLFKHRKELGIIFTLFISGFFFVIGAHVFQNLNATGTLFTSWLYLVGVAVIFFCTLILTIFAYIHQQQRFDDANATTDFEISNLHNNQSLPNTIVLVLCICSLTLALFSLETFYTKSGTAFEWPGIDMGPFFERNQNPSFAPNDFFTNTSSQPNPRHIFGNLIIGLQNIFDTSWYTIYFCLRILFVTTLPVLLLLTLTAGLKKHVPQNGRLIIAIVLATIGIGVTYIDRINGIVSIGWWTPLNLSVMSQTTAIYIGLLYIAACLHFKHQTYRFFIPLLFLATFIHPAIGFFIFALSVIFDLDPKQLRRYLESFFIGITVPFILIALMFKSSSQLTALEFVYHYIYENHAFHYLPSMLGNYTSFPWYVSFSLICAGFTTLLLFLIYKKDRVGVLFTAGSLLLYCGSVGAQYLFVELYPIKIIATIGPIRFTMFGYWLLLFGAIYCVARHLPPRLIPYCKELLPDHRSTATAFTVGVFLAVMIGAPYTIDDPVKKIKDEQPGLAQWVTAHTSPEDIFAVYPNFSPSHFTLAYGRGVYFGNGFPFLESAFVEYNHRKALLYGLQAELEKLPGEPWEQASLYYRTRLINDFLKAASTYRLDYIILEKDFAVNFSTQNPVFENQHIKIYAVDDLQHMHQ